MEVSQLNVWSSQSCTYSEDDSSDLPNRTRKVPVVETNSTASSETASKYCLESVPNREHCFPVIVFNLPPLLVEKRTTATIKCIS